nr:MULTISPECIES: autotransporter domain-containing protein [Pseudomonas]
MNNKVFTLGHRGSTLLIGTVVLAAEFACLSPVQAQSLIWGGVGSTTQTTDYTTASNWQGNPTTAPVTSADDARFDQTGSQTIQVSVPITPRRWLFLSPRDYTFTGADITFDSGGAGPHGILSTATAGGYVSISNNIGGSNVLIDFAGSGTLLLSGRNTFTGRVTVFSGSTVSIAKDALSSGVSVNLNGGTLDTRDSFSLGNPVAFTDQDGIFTQAPGSTLTLDQPVSGTGGFTQAGPGTLIFDAASSYVGATFVTGGRLIVNSDLTDSVSLDVSQGAFLGGVGTLPVSFVDGIIAPGRSAGDIGTLSVNGVLTLSNSSIYQIEIGPSGVSDLINVDGSAVLEGGGVNIVNANPVFTAGSQYKILSASGGVSGTFGNQVQHLPLVDLSLTYDPNNVYFNVTPNQSTVPSVIQPTNPTPTQTQTATGVQSLPLTSPVLAAILVQPTVTDINSSLDQLSGQTYASLRSSFIEDSRFVRDAINDRLTTPVTGERVDNGLYVNSWNNGAVWLKGFGSWADRDETRHAAELKRNIGGFFIGADLPFNDNVVAGVAAGYSRSKFDIDDRNSDADSDNYTIAAYSGANFGAWRARLGAAYTWSDISADRDVIFTGFRENVNADYDAKTEQVFGEVGREFKHENLALEPFAGLAWVNLDTEGFSEKGGDAALNVDDSRDNVTFSTLGLRASGDLPMFNGRQLRAKGMLGWRHAFGDLDPSDNVQFISGSSPFQVDGLPVADDTAVLEAGLELAISSSVKLGLAYTGQFASDVTDSGVSSQLIVEF